MMYCCLIMIVIKKTNEKVALVKICFHVAVLCLQIYRIKYSYELR